MAVEVEIEADGGVDCLVGVTGYVIVWAAEECEVRDAGVSDGGGGFVGYGCGDGGESLVEGDEDVCVGGEIVALRGPRAGCALGADAGDQENEEGKDLEKKWKIGKRGLHFEGLG